jgi:C-terminal processing protease CtpA/Prc
MFIALHFSGCLEKPPCKNHMLDEFTEIVRKNSLFSNSLDWNHITRVKDSFCQNGKTDANFLFRQFVITALRNVGDKHSLLINRDVIQKMEDCGLINVPPKMKVVEEQIVYLMLSGYASFDKSQILQYATSLQDTIRAIDQSLSVKGWVIDLRKNNGGNMWPMIAGLGPILGNGDAGYFINSEKSSYKWTYRDGEFGIIRVKNFYIVKEPNAPIAILTGNRTSSSGEMTLIAFLGKSNVRTFGAPTGGFVTANGNYTLSDGTIVWLWLRLQWLID